MLETDTRRACETRGLEREVGSELRPTRKKREQIQIREGKFGWGWGWEAV